MTATAFSPNGTQPWTFGYLQNAATGDGDGTIATVGGFNGAQMVELVNTGDKACAVDLQTSYDGTNWYNVGYYRVDGQATLTRSVSQITVTATTFRQVYQVLDAYFYLKVKISGTSAGTALAVTANLYAVSH